MVVQILELTRLIGFAVTWIWKRAPELVAGLGLLDPASMFLHHPSVLQSILYFSPRNSRERIANFIFREELFWNYHARRFFFWYANILFLEEVSAEIPIAVILSEQDEVVPVKASKSYVEKYIARHKGDHDVELVYFNNCDHGGWLWNVEQRRRVAKAIESVAEFALKYKE